VEVERETRFELATSTLARFEPVKAVSLIHSLEGSSKALYDEVLGVKMMKMMRF